MGSGKQPKLKDVVKVISTDRERTSLLWKIEQKLIAYFVSRVPSWISSDMLTGIGLFGGVIIFVSFFLAAFVNKYLLLINIVGFMIHWFGDSLDGRIAYYRKKPRKWYGFSLDITTDWLGTILMGMGYMVYAEGAWKFLGFGFVVMYGWEILTALLRYKISGKYSIDSGVLGPTEVRVVLSTIFSLEVFVPHSIYYTGIVACTVLFISNIVETKKVLKMGDELDKQENAAKK